MKTSLSLRKLTTGSDDIQKAIQLYNDAFPSCERRDNQEWLDCISHAQGEPFTLFGIYKDDVFTGFISAWDFSDFIYLEHFAILAKERGNGIGAQVMELIKTHYNQQPLVLEAEPPIEEIAVRRIGFYQRLGFQINETIYQQPPYRKGEQWFELKLMTTHPNFLHLQYNKVKETIYRQVYHV